MLLLLITTQVELGVVVPPPQLQSVEMVSPKVPGCHHCRGRRVGKANVNIIVVAVYIATDTIAIGILSSDPGSLSFAVHITADTITVVIANAGAGGGVPTQLQLASTVSLRVVLSPSLQGPPGCVLLGSLSSQSTLAQMPSSSSSPIPVQAVGCPRSCSWHPPYR